MADVCQLLLACLIQNKINEIRCVVLAHIDIIETPEFFLALVHGLVSLSESVASVVAKPHIVPLINQGEGRS